MLSLIGWDDRISSFQVKNGQSGVFWTDWLYGGTRYTFCCNQLVASLGSWLGSLRVRTKFATLDPVKLSQGKAFEKVQLALAAFKLGDGRLGKADCPSRGHLGQPSLLSRPS